MEDFPREFLPESLFDAETDAQRIHRNEAIAKDAYERAKEKAYDVYRRERDYPKNKMFKGLQSREMGKRPAFLRDVYEKQIEQQRVFKQAPSVAIEAIHRFEERIEEIREENRNEPMDFQVYIERIAEYRDRIEQARDLQRRAGKGLRNMPESVAYWLGIGELRDPDSINWSPPDSSRYAD